VLHPEPRVLLKIPPASATIAIMNAIRVIYDGKSFVPLQPVSLPDRVEAVVYVDSVDPAAQTKLDAEIRAYYQQADAEDAAWGKAVEPKSQSAWDED
jgi:hypothetical protein